MTALMQPDCKLITISNNEHKIKQLLTEMVVEPRNIALKWAQVTKQTANIKIGYPGQHLASLITGIEGEMTGARGNDLKDGSEVKSCSRIDQLDKCANKECKSPVARYETSCSACGSTDIERKNDSKWLFTIRSEVDLELLVSGVPRVLLVIGDYPKFDEGKFNILRFQAFEIWPGNERFKNFSDIMTNYFNNIYSAHKAANAAKTPAPKNFWPYSYQFYMCNPIKTFECLVDLSNRAAGTISITHYIKPTVDRAPLPSELMPGSLLTATDETELAANVPVAAMKRIAAAYRVDPGQSNIQIMRQLPGIPEELRQYLSLREDRTATAKNSYSRRTY